jgi:hypothetical protein
MKHFPLLLFLLKLKFQQENLAAAGKNGFCPEIHRPEVVPLPKALKGKKTSAQRTPAPKARGRKA